MSSGKDSLLSPGTTSHPSAPWPPLSSGPWHVACISLTALHDMSKCESVELIAPRETALVTDLQSFSGLWRTQTQKRKIHNLCLYLLFHTYTDIQTHVPVNCKNNFVYGSQHFASFSLPPTSHLRCVTSLSSSVRMLTCKHKIFFQ